MITKFNDYEEHTSLEFSREGNTLIVKISNFEYEEFSNRLSEDDLFSLIGQLLRIQSEIKKGGINV